MNSTASVQYSSPVQWPWHEASRPHTMSWSKSQRNARVTLAALLSAISVASISAPQVDVPGPSGSRAFGTSVTVLPNGNIVVTDPDWSGTAPRAGAVYLYSHSGQMISALRGNAEDDRVGRGGVTVLSNGNFVVSSPEWRNGAATDAGAVTWIDGDSGLEGQVSPENSLVGTSRRDLVGSNRVIGLSNGNYVICSANWRNGSAPVAGAVTWANGAVGLSGEVSPTNSLVGTKPGDEVGIGHVVVLDHGNFVVRSVGWHGGRGAATWVDGDTGISGAVSARNSLIGTTSRDLVGFNVVPLTNGNYVVVSPTWDRGMTADVGAVTWASGESGLSGYVSDANSLVGRATRDHVGGRFNDQDGRLGPAVSRLEGGDFVIASPEWDSDRVADVGAVTWVDGNAMSSGVVAENNSLMGAKSGDRVGSGAATPLRNGNYVVVSPWWSDDGMENAGAATWVRGGSPRVGVVSGFNSLTGSSSQDRIGSQGVVALDNGHYTVSSPKWDGSGSTDVGAVTWADGTSGRSGPVSADNSLVGTTAFDFVGDGGVTPGVVALANGNYVVTSYAWDRSITRNAGAVTWGNGSLGTIGAVSPANSLVGSSAEDNVGFTGVTALTNGNYVVASGTWRNGTAANAGAFTWVDGASAYSATVSITNSMVGTVANDFVGLLRAKSLPDGNYFVDSGLWTGCGPREAGAVTLGRGDRKTAGIISRYNSAIGSIEFESGMSVAYDASAGRLVIGRPGVNAFSFFELPTDLVFGNSFDCP